jgi:hypothetical protein
MSGVRDCKPPRIYSRGVCCVWYAILAGIMRMLAIIDIIESKPPTCTGMHDGMAICTGMGDDTPDRAGSGVFLQRQQADGR